MDKALLERTPDLRGIADVRLMSLEDGPGRGQRLLLARNAAGVQFEVAVDRGFDISALSFGGTNIGWHSPAQLRYPPTDPNAEDGWAFLRNFDGFLVTCGLDHFSRPREVDISHLNHPHLASKPMPLHGRIATEKARLVHYGVDCDTGLICCEGLVRQASVFGEVIELHRRVSLALGEATLRIDDRVSNRGFRSTRHAILYHLNFGFPFLDSSLEIAGLPPPLELALRNDPPVPMPSYGERVDLIDAAAIADAVTLRNPAKSIAAELCFDRTHLTKFGVWRAYQSGVFALGLEPRTEPADLRPLLEPGESHSYSVELTLASVAGPA